MVVALNCLAMRVYTAAMSCESFAARRSGKRFCYLSELRLGNPVAPGSEDEVAPSRSRSGSRHGAGWSPPAVAADPQQPDRLADGPQQLHRVALG
jgi:hypothetical protein